MNYTGGECYYVNGLATEGHAWNIAKMDNGEWYYFDLTWNDKGKDNQTDRSGKAETHEPFFPEKQIE